MAQTVEVPGVGDVDFPDNMSQEQIISAIQRLPAPKATPQNRGNVINSDVPTVVGERPNAVNPQPVAKPVTMMDRLKTLYEVPTAIVAPMVTEPLSMAYGVARSVPEAIATGGNAPELANKYYEQASQAMRYQPTSPESQAILGTIGEGLNAAKIPAYTPVIGKIPSAMQAASAVKPVLQESVMPVANRMAQALRTEGQMIKGAVEPLTSRVAQAVEPVTSKVNNMADALRAKVTVEGAPPMSGVGAAEVPEAMTRYQTAQQLRVPVNLSKGMAERDLGLQQFEAETAKQYPDTIGKPLIINKAQANDDILKNFDAYVDATGKETYGLRETGKVVDKALIKQVKEKRDEINAAYKAAEQAGEMQEPVPYVGITQYIEKQTPTVRAKLAPILDAVDEQIKVNDPNRTGAIPINALEDVYKFINKNYDPSDSVAMIHASEMKKLINEATKDRGGELYQKARALRTSFGSQFEDVGAIDKLLRTKKGTTDRAVAFEDVFKHAILDGSKDDVATIGLTLKKGGKEGQQAWKELQGQTIQHIKDKVTSSIDVDSFGNPVVSPAKFKSAINELDQDGKLDYIFGKKGAEEIRSLYETTLNVNAPLKGAVNYSNTSSALMKALDNVSILPVARVIGVKQGLQKIKESQIKKQVEKSVNYNPEDMAKALKGKSNE
jgi:hypothetical protein